MNKLTLSSLLIAIAASTAHANSETAPPQVSMSGKWLVDITKHGKLFAVPEYLSRNANGITRCEESVAFNRSRGVTSFEDGIFEEFGGTQQGPYKRWSISLERAEQICRDAAYYAEVVLKELPVFKEALPWSSWGALVASQNRPDFFDQYAHLPDKCDAAVDRMLAANVSPTQPFPFSGVATVADLKPKLCNVVRENFKKYPEWYKQEQTSAREPYVKAGLKGDKLEFVLQYDGYIYLPGGHSTDNLKKIVASPSLFVWTQSDADGAGYVVHTVRKHVFKGNKLVKTSERTVRLPKGQEPSGKAFR